MKQFLLLSILLLNTFPNFAQNERYAPQPFDVKFTTEKIKIDGIDIIEKALYKHSVLETDNFNHKIITQAIANHEKKLAVVFVLIQIHKMDETNELLGKIVVGVGFDIENFDDVFPKNENGVIIFLLESFLILQGI